MKEQNIRGRESKIFVDLKWIFSIILNETRFYYIYRFANQQIYDGSEYLIGQSMGQEYIQFFKFFNSHN